MLALAVLWEVEAWPWWLLAAGYTATGVALFGLVTPMRRYEPPESDAETETFAAVQALSWLPVAAAIGVAIAALGARVEDPGVEMVSTVEYRALILDRARARGARGDRGAASGALGARAGGLRGAARA